MTLDLEQRLADYRLTLDQAIDDDLHDLVLADHSAPASRPRGALLAAAAAAVLIVGGVAVIAASTTQTRSAAGGVPVWQVAADPDGLFAAPPGGASVDTGEGWQAASNGRQINSVRSTSRGFVAVGTDTTGFATIGAIWASPDGASWDRASDPEAVFGSAVHGDSPDATSISINDIAEMNGRMVAIGYGFDRATSETVPLMWYSDDGQTWVRAVLPDSDGTVGATPLSIAAGHEIFVVASTMGQDRNGVVTAPSSIWTSTDGVSWTVVPLTDTSVDAGRVVATDSGFVVAGNDASNHPAAWFSTDAVTWTRTDMNVDDAINSPESPSMGRITALAATSGLIVAVGSLSSNTSFGWIQLPGSSQFQLDVAVRIAVWASEDGTHWNRADLPEPTELEQVYQASIATGGDGFVAMAERMRGSGPSSVMYSSADGVTWIETDVAVPGTPVSIAHGDRRWVVGATAGFPSDDGRIDSSNPTPGPADSAAIWLADD